MNIEDLVKKTTEIGGSYILNASLNQMLKAYYMTDIQTSEIFFESQHNNAHSNLYLNNYMQTILFAQHFTELACKELLRQKHELYPLKDLDDISLIHDLLNGCSNSKLNDKPTIEQSVAIRRLTDLIKKTNATQLQFIVDHKSVLYALNTLRNRIWHRGIAVLSYEDFDLLMAKYVLPLIKEFGLVSSLNCKLQTVPLDAQIEPIDEIMKEVNGNKLNVENVEFYKKLGLASYDNPLRHRPINSLLVKHYEKNAGKNSKKCPVCGINCLCIEEEHYPDNSVYASAYCSCCKLYLETSNVSKLKKIFGGKYSL